MNDRAKTAFSRETDNQDISNRRKRTALLSRASRATIVALLLGLPALSHSTASQKLETVGQPVSMFHDWTIRHVIYPRIGSILPMYAAQRDPRAIFSWRRIFILAAGGPGMG